jgi:hypothetical protein
MGAAVTPDQLIAFRVLAFAVGVIIALGMVAIWGLLIDEWRRFGFGVLSAFMSIATVAITVAIGALAYLGAVMQ